MSDAQLDSDIGGGLADFADGQVGNLSTQEAVRYYGLYSLIFSFGQLVAYALLNGGFTYMATSVSFYTVHAQTYAPVAMGWIVTSLFDSSFTRQIYFDVVALSLAGPFFTHWRTWLPLWQANGGTVTEYIWLAAYFVLNVLEMLFQVLLVPKVFDWAGNDGLWFDN